MSHILRTECVLHNQLHLGLLLTLLELNKYSKPIHRRLRYTYAVTALKLLRLESSVWDLTTKSQQVSNFILVIKPTRCTNFSNLFLE